MKSFDQLVQLSLPVITDVPPMRSLDDLLIKSCKDYSDAVRLCLEYRLRRMSEAEIAGYLGFSGPHLAKVKMGKGYLTTDQELVLQRICSNWAIRQYAARRETQLEEMIEKTESALSPEMQALVSRLVEEQLSQRLETRAA